MAQEHFTAYLLHFTTPLHISDHRADYGVSLTTISSDSFYAAITSTLVSMGQAVPAGGDFGCTISSLFPFCQLKESQEPILFFPRPQSAALPQLSDLKMAKMLKKVSWLDKAHFEQMLGGHPVLGDERSICAVYGKFLTEESEGFDEKFVVTAESQRVTIPFSDQYEPPMPFYMDKVLFKGHSGLFFLCKGDTSYLDKAMSLLQESGVGTDRNVGNGFFTFEKRSVDINVPDQVSAAVALSTYIPSSHEELSRLLDHPSAAYEMVRLGGWMTTADQTPLRRNVIHAFASGSVFAYVGQTVGCIVDLRPDAAPHPVYRCGRALMLPYKAL